MKKTALTHLCSLVFLSSCLNFFGPASAQHKPPGDLKARHRPGALSKQAGPRKQVAELIQDSKDGGLVFARRELFKASVGLAGDDSRLRELLSGGAVFDLDKPASERIIREKAPAMTLPLRDGKGGTVELELVKVDIFAPGFTVKTSTPTDEPVADSLGVHYRGVVKGEERSLAAISVFKHEVMGFYSTEAGGNSVLGRLGGDNPADKHVLYAATDLKSSPDFHCETSDDGVMLPPADLQEPEQLAARCVRMFLEANHDLFLNRGSVANTTSFLTGMFNQSATLFSNDGISVSISEIFVWTSPSPYDGLNSTGVLEQYRATRTSFNGDLAHLITLNREFGGVAFINTLCNSGFRYAVSDIDPGFSTVPTYSWSVEVFTHETGHNLGSPHTHACVWNGDSTAIDGCGTRIPSEGSCPLAPVPPGGGTIMSYCHLTGVGINFTLGFGPQPRNLILNRFNNAPCLTDCGGGGGGGGPANNNFASAQTISGNNGSVSGTNVGATKEAGEPNHAGNPGGTSIWYQWQAPATGTVTFVTAGSNFDTLLGAYTGTSVGALAARAGNDDVGGGNLTSRIAFGVTAGTTYRVAVDGFAAATGNVVLAWSLAQACSFSISPTSQSFASGGGAGGVSVTSPAGCAWTAASNSAFITINSGAGGAGNGSVNFTVAANPGASARSGSLTVAGRTFSVTQAGDASSAVQFNSTSHSVGESAGRVQLTVGRTGNVAAAASVGYATTNGTADRRKDYTQTLGTLHFAPGETSKTITVFITDDVFPETAETFTVSLSNAVGTSLGAASSAIVTINNNDATLGPNPVDAASFSPEFFVRQHYVDFLNREPDAGGLAFWTNNFTQCSGLQQCLELRRINVSAAFFLSIEFQETGYLVYRMYKTAFGDAASPGVVGTVPAVRLEEFLPDTQRIGRGVQVGVGAWQQQLEANKTAYALEFAQRQRFLSAFPASLTPTQFVDRLNQNAGAVLSAAERSQLIAELTSDNTPQGRASVFRKVAEDADLRNKEFRRAFVLMQYFGYLRRNPDDPQDPNFAGWKFWLDKLNEHNGDFVAAEMVRAFILSIEYKNRFGQ